jgi:hypothetical protein
VADKFQTGDYVRVKDSLQIPTGTIATAKDSRGQYLLLYDPRTTRAFSSKVGITKTRWILAAPLERPFDPLAIRIKTEVGSARKLLLSTERQP